METNQLSSAQIAARRKNSSKSTGPRTSRGKRHASRNALKHGLYSDVQYSYWDAAMELGEDPRDFRRLFAGLLEARRPADTLEQVLVEDIAVLIWKKARLERSESAVQVCNVRKHDLERRKQYIQVGKDVTTVSQAEAFEKGLRGMLDAPGKFEKVLSMLGMLEDLTARNEFSDDMHRLLLVLYGEKPTMRGVGMLNQFVKLRKLPREGPQFENAKTVFVATQAEETADVIEEYDLFLHEHVENTRAARMAAMAPSHAQWAAIIRQQNALHRQLERKIRLLDEIQERRRKMGSATDLLSRLAGMADPSRQSGQERVADMPEGAASAPPEGPDAAGVAHTSRGSESGCTRLSPQPGQEPAADIPDGGAPAPPEEAGVGAALVAALGQPQGFPPRPDENTQNSGNEAKKSLKTNDWVKMECAKPTHSGARNARNAAKNGAHECASTPARRP